MDKTSYKGYIEPAKIFGNIYFAGIHSASTHLIDTEEGLILLDPGYKESLWIVLENIRKLGLDPMEIKIILLSHGHVDHAGAAAELKALTGAKIYLGKGDLPMVRGEEESSWARELQCGFDYFEPDVLLEDGDTVTLGNTAIRCLSTPGHTEGTMSFFFDATDGIRTLRAGMHGGLGLNTLTKEYLEEHHLPLSNRDRYLAGLERAKKEPVELFLGNHVGNNDTEGKLQMLKTAKENPFIDADAFTACLDQCRNQLMNLIKKEQETKMINHTIDQILENKIIVIVRGVASDKLIPFAEAIYAGGIRLMECTYDATNTIPDEEIAANIEKLSKHFEGRMLIGAGTVIREAQVSLTKKAGGKFIISPDTDESIIKKTKEEGLVSIPGALTPSEVTTAHRAGADFIKLFPINVFGPSYVKTIKAPLSHVRVLAVGGVKKDNMQTYLESGACGFGLAGDIVNRPLIEAGDFEQITEITKGYTALLK